MHRTCYSLPRNRQCPFREGIRKKKAPSLSVMVALDRDLIERVLCHYSNDIEDEAQGMDRNSDRFSGTVEIRDALSAEYCSLEILGNPAVYTRSRLMEDTVPKAFHQYELAGGFDSGEIFFEVSANAEIGFMGTILCGDLLPLNDEGTLFITDADLDWDGRSITLTEFFHYGM